MNDVDFIYPPDYGRIVEQILLENFERLHRFERLLAQAGRDLTGAANGVDDVSDRLTKAHAASVLVSGLRLLDRGHAPAASEALSDAAVLGTVRTNLDALLTLLSSLMVDLTVPHQQPRADPGAVAAQLTLALDAFTRDPLSPTALTDLTHG